MQLGGRGNWAAMQIFRNASKNDQKNAKGQLASLRIVKSLVEITLSRSAADYILDELNVTTFIKTLEQAKYGMDEDFMGTLNANEIIGMPGGFTLQFTPFGTKARNAEAVNGGIIHAFLE
uniref:Phage major capsid protein n=1 Tax=Panagrolaimus sp. JU765 TaxID=591449 RepID=A0AC34QCH4_9BILA